MKVISISVMLTFLILLVMSLLATIAGYDVLEHLQLSGIATNSYYVTCSLVLWVSLYCGVKAEMEWDELRRKWDLEDKEWKRKNL